MHRNTLVFASNRCSGLAWVAILAVPLAVVACDDSALEAELAAEDAAFAADEAELAEDEAEDASGPAGAGRGGSERAAPGEAALLPGWPQPLCCSIDWQQLFQPRVRLSNKSSEGCWLEWPISLTAHAEFTVYHTGTSTTFTGGAGWLLPESVTFVPLTHSLALSASHCTATAMP